MASQALNVCIIDAGTKEKPAAISSRPFPVVESKCDYWMGEMVPPATKGWGGAVAATFCQIAPA